ncbi:MAG TPA: phosphoribosyltransferase family protein [Candidatus Moranbacteria bacterium]|nr:phosphoribosyltransferase family protein [Candidatus Moranbacteria bacterium]
MFEKPGNNSDQKPEISEYQKRHNNDEYHKLLSHASGKADNLSFQERERLAELGYYFLEIEKNKTRALDISEVLQDFNMMRKIADQLLLEQPVTSAYNLPVALLNLEDHESIRNLLNNNETLFKNNGYAKPMEPLIYPLFDYVKKFLNKNGTPIATGMINEGVDIIAIHNLAKQYDIAVPIARGGLYQGAIANLWDMPTKTVDISAHNRKISRGKWVDNVSKKDFEGKRVLLFDKDALTGASVRKTIKMLSKFKPASVGIYFTHNTIESGGVYTHTENLPKELKIFCPNNAPMQKAGDVYIEAHEKLDTLYGRRRKVEQLFMNEAQRIKERYPDLSKALEKFISEQLKMFDSLNPYLPGVSRIREHILLRTNSIFKEHSNYSKVNPQDDSNLPESNLYDFPRVMDNFKKMLSNTRPLPNNFERELIEARYEKQAQEESEKRGVENIHIPSYPLTAFEAAREAVKKEFDVALIVGPEGFAYEPYFIDLGLPTLAINIPESKENETRTLTSFDDLSVLKNKKVLVVEDDVRTGATLQKIIEHIKPYAPAQLGLYLGQPAVFQKTESIPSDFSEIYMAKSYDDSENAAKNFLEYLESKGLKLFKTTSKDNQ